MKFKYTALHKPKSRFIQIIHSQVLSIYNFLKVNFFHNSFNILRGEQDVSIDNHYQLMYS